MAASGRDHGGQANLDPGSAIGRVYLVVPEFQVIDGVAEQITTLAVELSRRGIDVWVFVRRPYATNNQYARRLRSYGISLVSPPRLLGFLARPSWADRDWLLRLIVSLLYPLLLLPSVFDSLLRSRSVRRSWSGAAGYLNRVLGTVILPDYLDRLFYAQMDWYANRYPPDIVEVSRCDYVQGLLWGHRRGLPTVYREHGTVLQRSEEQIECLRKARCFIAVSEAAGEALRVSGKVQTKLFVIPNVVPDTVCSGPVEHIELDLSAFGSAVIACVSRLSPEKGMQHLPEIAGRVVSQVRDACFLIAGDGPLGVELERKCREQGLAEHVHFLGAVSREAVLKLLRRADIFVLPSLTEGMPVSVIEAMACGLPIIATSVGGTPELITDGVSGLLVPTGDPASIGEAIVRLLNDRALRDRLGKAARLAYENGPWTPEVAGDLTLSAYRYAMDTVVKDD